ncbi:hypothetical protein Saa2_04709 [Streptomyces acidiscabies]|nr:hypothetical protein Saa2_04709 [Streptomyces acidiscabies]
MGRTPVHAGPRMKAMCTIVVVLAALMWVVTVAWIVTT